MLPFSCFSNFSKVIRTLNQLLVTLRLSYQLNPITTTSLEFTTSIHRIWLNCLQCERVNFEVIPNITTASAATQIYLISIFICQAPGRWMNQMCGHQFWILVFFADEWKATHGGRKSNLVFIAIITSLLFLSMSHAKKKSNFSSINNRI
jgi:hypothetical protein